MVVETERTERTITAVQAIHIAFALVGICVKLALDEEALSQERLQPRRPPVVLVLRATSSLYTKQIPQSVKKTEQ